MNLRNKRLRFNRIDTSNSELQIDFENRIIRGISLFQANVVALGHGVMGDESTLTALKLLGNLDKSGVKSRLGHPGLSEDGTAKQIGRMYNLQVKGDKVIGDLHFLESAKYSPVFTQDPAMWLMTQAKEAPGHLGMSVVIDADYVWKLEDGTEEDAIGVDGYFTSKPENAVNDLPLIRPTELVASDIVDEPAANRDGLFYQLNRKGYSAHTAAKVFDYIDQFLEENGFTRQKAYEFAIRYFDHYGVLNNATQLGSTIMENNMSKQHEEGTAKDVATAPATNSQTEPANEPTPVGLDAGLIEQIADGLQLNQAFGNVAEHNKQLAEQVAELSDLVGTLQSQLLKLSEQFSKIEFANGRAESFSTQTETVTPTLSYLNLFSGHSGIIADTAVEQSPVSVINDEQHPSPVPVRNQLSAVLSRYQKPETQRESSSQVPLSNQKGTRAKGEQFLNKLTGA